MDHQPTNKHRDVAGVIELPTSSWVKLITLSRLARPEVSKRQVVIDLISEAHEQMLLDMGDLMGGGKNND